jgi:prefoldin subunit 5
MSDVVDALNAGNTDRAL